METSAFMDKNFVPDNNDLKMVLAGTYNLWEQIHNLVIDLYPKAIGEWNYAGKNYGWSYRLKDKKRAIIYLLPRKGYFKVAFVFGQKATDKILMSDVSDEIKNDLSTARIYAEGRGIRIDVKNGEILKDIATLIDIKISI